MTVCEMHKDGAWVVADATEALRHRALAMRCAVCHGRVVAHGAYRPIGQPRFVHHRRACTAIAANSV